MYMIISTIGVLVRMYLISNAFEGFFEDVLIAYVVNATIGEFILRKTTYYLSVGSVYEKNSLPAWGSFLYTFFYFINNGIMYFACWVCKQLSLSCWFIIVIYFIVLLPYVLIMRKLNNSKTNDMFD